jgi:hypothetical protein
MIARRLPVGVDPFEQVLAGNICSVYVRFLKQFYINNPIEILYVLIASPNRARMSVLMKMSCIPTDLS